MKTAVRSYISIIINIFVIIAFVLGTMNAGISNVQAGSTEPPDGSAAGLEIAQGTSIHLDLLGENQVTFTLDVKDPSSTTRYLWKVLNPPSHGTVALTGSWARAAGTYTVEGDFNGTDLFTVQVTDGSGATDQVGVFVRSLGMDTERTRSYRQPEINFLRPDSQAVTHTAPPVDQPLFLPEPELAPELSLPLEQAPETDFSELAEKAQLLKQLSLLSEMVGTEEPLPQVTLEPPFEVDAPAPGSDAPAPKTDGQPAADKMPSGETLDPATVSIGLVLDSPVDESNGFTWMAHLGLQNAVATYTGLTGNEYLATSTEDYATLFAQCVSEGNDMCIGVGWMMTDAIVAAANANPGVMFVILDSTVDPSPDNLRGVMFASEEAAYLAGRLAARMTSRNTVATIGGMKIPTVTAFTQGYRNGAQCTDTNPRALVDYTGDFLDTDLAAEYAEMMMYYGADVVFAVAGPAGEGALDYAVGNGGWAIGVDTDQYYSFFGGGSEPGADHMLTSVLKRLDTAVYKSIEDYLNEVFTTAPVYYGLVDEGVGLAPYHDAAVPPEVQVEIDALEDDIINGLVNVYDSCRKPQLGIDPENDTAWVWNWPAFSDVTLLYGSEYTPINSGRTDDWGNVNFEDVGFDIVPGDIFSADDGEFHKEHEVQYVTIDYISTDDNTVSGAAGLGQDVRVWACHPGADCAGVWATADGDGVYIGDLDDADTPFDILPGDEISSHRWDDDGDVTVVSMRVPRPIIVVSLNQDYVWGIDFQPGDAVALEIDGEHQETRDVSMDSTFQFDGYDINVDASVRVYGSSADKDTVVRYIEVTDVDLAADTISGTSDQLDGDIQMIICEPDVNCGEYHTTSDSSGNWTFDFAGDRDVRPGSFGFAQLVDEDGDSSQWNWSVSPAVMDARPLEQMVAGYNWPDLNKVELTLNGASQTGKDNGEGTIDFWDLSEELDAGDELVMSDGEVTKYHTVKALTLDGYDLDENTVWGTTDADAEVWLGACTDGDCRGERVDADGSGNWSYDFDAQGLVLKPGSDMWFQRFNTDGTEDRTSLYIHIPYPVIRVDPSIEEVWGHEFLPDAEISIEVQGVGTYYTKSDENGNFGTNLKEYVDFTGGETVIVSDGERSKTLLVTSLVLYDVDVDTDIVNGEADPGSDVDVWANDNDSDFGTTVQADGDTGYYEFDFTDNPINTDVDITRGSNGGVARWDDDGDCTNINWHIPDPRFTVNLNRHYVHGDDWTPGETLTLTVRGTEVATATVNGDSTVHFDTPDYNIEPGDTVSVSNGAGITKTLVVSPLTVTNVDKDTDTITGTTVPNGEVYVDGINDPIYADIDGNWIGYFPWDIGPGHEGFARRFEGDDDGDWTEWYWRVPDPRFEVDPDENHVWGDGWPIFEEVTLTIGGYTDTRQADGDGHVDFGQVPIDLVVGSYVEMSGGGYSKDHTVLPFEIMDFDVITDQIFGTTVPDHTVGAWACDDNHCDGNDSTSGLDGDWMVDLSEVWDLVKGSNGGAHVLDEDGDGTHRGWRIPNPSFDVNPDYNNVWGWEWPVDSEVTLTVNGVEFGTRVANENGDWSFDNIRLDLVVGDELEVTYDVITKYHKIVDFEITNVDIDTDTISGTAPAGQWVDAWIHYSCGMGVETDESGNWAVDLSEFCDIVKGSSGSAKAMDEDGDGTNKDWHVPNPSFAVNPEWDNVWGWDWPAGSDVTLTIGTFTRTRQANEWGEVNFDAVGFDIPVGAHLEMTSGAIYKEHYLENLVLDGYSEEYDWISIYADPYDTVNVWACDYDNCSGMDFTDEDGDGIIMVDTLTMGIDMAPGTSGNIAIWDIDGDGTVIEWRVPNPVFAVNPETEEVWGWKWPAYEEITLSIDGVVIGTTMVDANGNFGFGPVGFNIPWGAHLEVESTGGTYKDHYLAYILFDGYDVDTDHVFATTDPDAWVHANSCDYDNCDGRDFQADSAGVLDAWLGIMGIDIAPGTDGNVGRWDDDGDGTEIHWRVPFPAFSVSAESDNVWGEQFLGSTTITLTRDDGFTTTTTSDPNGNFDFYGLSVDLQPGDYLEVSDGTTTKTHTIVDYAITDVDVAADTVSGTAPAGMWVDAWACDENQCQGERTTTGEEGNWTVDLSDRWDIKPGTWGGARAVDDDEDGTQKDWNLPNPRFEAQPQRDVVVGWDWTPNTMITLVVGGTTIPSIMSDDTGWVRFNTSPVDLQPGQLVEMSDGVHTKYHSVTPIVVTSIDEVNDILSGTAPEDSPLNVRACDSGGCTDLYPTATGGVWTADFSGSVDIGPGAEGAVWFYDIDSDDTRIHWFVPRPWFAAFPQDGNVSGWLWPSAAEVDLSIESVSVGTETADTWNGGVYFTGLTFAAGDTLEMSTAGYTPKIHEVPDLVVTGADELAEMVSGTAPADTAVDVFACGDEGCYGYSFPVDSLGNWTATFAGDVDIKPGVWIYVDWWDDDGDVTEIYWIVPVTLLTSTTTITSDNPDPSYVGQAYSVYVTVSGSGATPTGTVDIDDGSGASCTATLSSGSGNCSLISTSSGSKTLTAAYSGDSVYDISDDTETHQVNKSASTTTITGDSPDPSSVGQSYTVSVSVSGTYGVGSGTVGVSDGSGGTCTVTLSGGSGSCSLTSTSAGSKTLTASFPGDAKYNSSSGTATHTVNKSASTTTITSDLPDPSAVGQSFLVEVTVTGGFGTATGTVNVSDGSGATCSFTLSGGGGSCGLTSTSSGTKTVTASYGGDGAYNASSDTETHTVNKSATTTTITSDDPDPSVVGQSYTVNVTVSGSYGAPTGTVAINDGTGATCSAALSGGAGSCSLTSTSTGTKTLTASYPGNTVYNASSDTEEHQVNKAASTTTISADTPDPSYVGQSYPVSVSVSGAAGTATGTVAVSDGSGATCTVTLSGGSGSCSLTSTSAGTKTLTADYSGNSVYNTSSDTETHTVNKSNSTTTITNDTPDPSTVGQSYMVYVSVSGSYGTASGSVEVSDGAGATCTAPLTSGTGSCSLTSTSAGAKTLTASFPGDGKYNASSGTASHTVSKAATTTTITGDSPDPSVAGQTYTVTVTVTGAGGTPTGTVNVSDGSGATCSITLASGGGSCDLTSTTSGSKTLTASYLGDGNYNTSSDTETHTVNKLTSTTTINSDTPDPSAVGQSYSVNVTVTGSGATPGGTVGINDGSGATCTATLAGGTGSCSLISTSAGTKTLTASYSGDGVYAVSSDTESHQVNKSASTTTITNDSPDPSNTGQAYAVSVTVTGSYGTASGTVAVDDGTGATCTATLSGGSGSCVLTSTTSGSKTITAAYAGDGKYESSSDTEAHTVNVTVSDNDDIDTPDAIPGVPYEVSKSTLLATHETGDPSFAACGQTIGLASVWYEFNPTVSGETTLDTFGSNYNTMLGVWSGAPGSLTLVGCNNDSSGTTQSKLTFKYTGGVRYLVGVATRGAVETGGNMKLHVATFADVAGNHPLWKFVEGFFKSGITTGCAVNPMRYCPDRNVTRGEMAVFVLRAIHKDELPYTPTPSTTGIFADVPTPGKDWMQPWIEEFYEIGITTGCAAGPLRYCPERNVTRGEMAVFMLRAMHVDALPYTPHPSRTGMFVDVPVPGKEWMQPWIEEFYLMGITTGCGGSEVTGDLRYCPERNVNRAEMATFVDRAFSILPVP